MMDLTSETETKKMSYQKEDIEWDSAQAESECDLSEEKMAKLENMAWDNDRD